MILLHERYGLRSTRSTSRRSSPARLSLPGAPPFSRHAEQDRLLTGEVQAPLPDPESAEDLGASIDFLRREVPSAEASSVAVMGVCQTGRHPLVLAAGRSDVNACLVFYAPPCRATSKSPMTSRSRSTR